jgi:hypothetical protein
MARLSARQGLDRLAALVSLDCDTPEDIAVVTDVHQRLRDSGITPVYAVPGQLLERGALEYGTVAADGAEFLNHGWVQHCRIDPATGEYVSSHFYDEIGRLAAERDIGAGHDALTAFLGTPPKGFRTPHFGTFSHRRDLAWLQGVLAERGYRFSSSTLPLKAIQYGPVQRTRSGIVELPVSGRPSAPHQPLDSWSFRFAPGRRIGADDFAADLGALLSWHERTGAPGLINIFADPSQIYDWPEFFDAVALLAPYAVPSYSALLDEVVG